MKPISHQVWQEIDQDVVLRSAFEKDIISQKNLAVYLIKAKEGLRHATLDAVISAIRRYKVDSPLEKKYAKARTILAQSEDIKITSNMCSIALHKNNKTQLLIPKIVSTVCFEKGDILLINQAEQSLKIITNEKNKKVITKLFSDEDIITIEHDLAQINIQLYPDAVRTPGIIATLTSELMLHDINITECMSCVPEMLFFVHKKDIVKTYDLLFTLCKIQKR